MKGSTGFALAVLWCAGCSALPPQPPDLPQASKVPDATNPHLVIRDSSAIWWTEEFTSTLTKTHPVSRQPLAKVKLPLSYAVEDMAAGYGAVWVVSGGSKPTICRIDARTNRVTHQETLASLWGSKGKRTYVAVGEGAVWATVNVMDQLFRLDPLSGQVTDTIPLNRSSRSDQFHRLAAGAGAVWVLHQQSVSRVDPVSRKVVATIPVPGTGYGVGDITVGDGSVWVAATSNLVRIDPRTNRVTDTLSVMLDPRSSPGRYCVGHMEVGNGSLHALMFESQANFSNPTYGGYALIEVDTRSRRIRSVRRLGAGDLARLFCGPIMTVSNGNAWVSQPTGIYVVPVSGN